MIRRSLPIALLLVLVACLGAARQLIIPAPSAPPTGPTAIARWDTVPDQVIAAPFNVSVVAHHLSGINRVEFSANGGPALAILAPTINPQTGVSEHWCTVDPAKVTGGRVVITATAYPESGTPRVLPPLTLHTTPAPEFYISPTGDDRADGSAARPWFSTYAANVYAPVGAVIRCMPGEYRFHQRTTGFRDDGGKWLTFTPAPGITRAQVTFLLDAPTDARMGRLCLRNVRLKLLTAMQGCRGLWLDNCDTFGSLANPPANGISFLQPEFCGPIYVTRGIIRDLPYTPLTKPELVRGVTIKNVYTHGINDPRLLVRTTITNVLHRPGTDDHVDGIFWYSTNEDVNCIVQDVTLTQIHGLCLLSDRGLSNLALVRVSATAAGVGIGGACQFGKGIFDNTLSHLLFLECSLPNQRLVLVDTPNNVWTHSAVRECTLFDYAAKPETAEVRNLVIAQGE